jgi:type I restriction enzyme M protein
MVDVMRPDASMRVCDPAAGTGGFLLAAFEQMKTGPLDPDEKRFLPDEAFRGWEIVDATARLCAMNLLLHGISAPESPRRGHGGRRAARSRLSTLRWC